MQESFLNASLFGVFANEPGARVKMSPTRLKTDYLGIGTVLVIARLQQQLIGYAVATVPRDVAFAGCSYLTYTDNKKLCG